MKHTHFSFGFHSTEQESRLCRFTEVPEEKIPDARKSFANKIDTSILRLLRELEIGAVDAATEENLRREALWVDAFSRPDIFTAPEDPNATSNKPFGPNELLRRLPLNKRFVEFIRFTQGVVPADVIANHQARNQIFHGNPAFLETADELEKHEGEPGFTLAGSPEKIQKILLLIMGEETLPKNRIDKEVWAVAEETFKSRYQLDAAPGAMVLNKNLKDDFRLALYSARSDLAEFEILRPELITDRLPPCRLKGAIRMGLIPPTMLSELINVENQKRASQNMEMHKAEQSKNIIDRSVQERIKKEGRTFVNNWRSMRGKEKFFAMGLLGFAVYKMLKSESKFWSTLPFIVGGGYLYQRLVRGDKRPLNTWGVAVNRGMNKLGKAIRPVGEKLGFVDKLRQDEAELQMIGDFLKRNGQAVNPAATGFYCMAEVKMESIANAFNFDKNPDGTLRECFELKEGTSLATDLEGVARRRNFDSEEMMKYMCNNNGEVADAAGYVFYLLGAEKNPAIEGRLRAMQQETGARDIEDINDPEARRLYRQMVLIGRDRARTEFAGESLIDIIHRFPEAGLQDRNLDRADIKNPNSKKHEATLYAKVREPIQLPNSQPRKEILDLSKAASAEAILDLKNIGIIDGSAVTELEKRFDILRSDRGMRLSDILFRIEQLKYALVLFALNRETFPITGEDIKQQMSVEGGGITPILTFINEWIVHVKQQFGEVQSMASVRAMLKGIIPGGARSANKNGYPILLPTIDKYENAFKALKRMDLLNPTRIRQLGGGTAGKKAMDDIYKLPRYQQRVEAMEKYFAQRCAYAIALATLVTHRTGTDSLDKTMSERLITPREEANLAREFDRLFEEIVGDVTIVPNSPTTHSKEGIWEWIDVKDEDLHGGIAGGGATQNSASKTPTLQGSSRAKSKQQKSPAGALPNTAGKNAIPPVSAPLAKPPKGPAGALPNTAGNKVIPPVSAPSAKPAKSPAGSLPNAAGKNAVPPVSAPSSKPPVAPADAKTAKTLPNTVPGTNDTKNIPGSSGIFTPGKSKPK